jgi:hypothetical protein
MMISYGRPIARSGFFGVRWENTAIKGRECSKMGVETAPKS